MAGKKRSLISTVRGVVVLLWALVSLVVTGIACVLVAPLHNGVSQAIALLWMRLLLLVSGIRVEVRGIEKIHPGKRYVFICNHQSHLDIPVLLASLPFSLSFIAKKELFSIPFFGWGMHALGHVWIDRGNARKAHTSIQHSVEQLQKRNFSLVLFPEGTRSVDGTLGQFKQGSFTLVQRAGVEVVPVTIRNTSKLLPKYSLLVTSGTARLIIGDPLTINEATPKADISEQIRTIIETTIRNDID